MPSPTCSTNRRSKGNEASPHMRITHEWLGELDLPDAPSNATETVFLLGGSKRLILTLELRRHGYGVFPVPLPHSPWGVVGCGSALAARLDQGSP